MLELSGHPLDPPDPLVPIAVSKCYLLQKKPTTIMNHLFSVLNYTQFGTGPLTVFGGVEVGEN